MRLFLLIFLAACQRPTPSAPRGQLSNTVDFSDPTHAFQVERGLWDVENKAWRWTSGHFVVRLAPPIGARGATLKISVTIPAPVIERNHDATLSCSVNGAALPPETWTTTGDFVLVREVPPISGPAATLECSVAKIIPAGALDARELGLIVKRISLEAK